MTFYHTKWCPECQLVREKLDNLGIQYQDVAVPDFRPHRKQVYEASGQYYVPVLVADDTVLTETHDILEYLDAYSEKIITKSSHHVQQSDSETR